MTDTTRRPAPDGYKWARQSTTGAIPAWELAGAGHFIGWEYANGKEPDAWVLPDPKLEYTVKVAPGEVIAIGPIARYDGRTVTFHDAPSIIQYGDIASPPDF